MYIRNTIHTHTQNQTHSQTNNKQTKLQQSIINPHSIKTKSKNAMSFIINFFKNLIHNMLQLLSFSRKTLKNTLNIYVKFNRDTLSVDLDPKWEIREVKELVAPQLGLQPNEVKIIFAGKELSDTTKLEVNCIDFWLFLLVVIFIPLF